jgi:hypothetical protein
MMIGWVRAPSPAEKAFLKESVRELPEYGRLTGRGGTANLENVLKFKPDLIIDVGSVAPTYVSLANNVHEQTQLVRYADEAVNAIPEAERPSVYYGRGVKINQPRGARARWCNQRRRGGRQEAASPMCRLSRS